MLFRIGKFGPCGTGRSEYSLNDCEVFAILIITLALLQNYLMEEIEHLPAAG